MSTPLCPDFACISTLGQTQEMLALYQREKGMHWNLENSTNYVQASLGSQKPGQTLEFWRSGRMGKGITRRMRKGNKIVSGRDRSTVS